MHVLAKSLTEVNGGVRPTVNATPCSSGKNSLSSNDNRKSRKSANSIFVSGEENIGNFKVLEARNERANLANVGCYHSE